MEHATVDPLPMDLPSLACLPFLLQLWRTVPLPLLPPEAVAPAGCASMPPNTVHVRTSPGKGPPLRPASFLSPFPEPRGVSIPPKTVWTVHSIGPCAVPSSWCRGIDARRSWWHELQRRGATIRRKRTIERRGAPNHRPREPTWTDEGAKNERDGGGAVIGTNRRNLDTKERLRKRGQRRSFDRRHCRGGVVRCEGCTSWTCKARRRTWWTSTKYSSA